MRTGCESGGYWLPVRSSCWIACGSVMAVPRYAVSNPAMLCDAQSSPTELTILMPCLNEAETIAICVKKASSYLSRSHIRGEILIADNGSTDGSQAVAQRFGARVVSISERGYGAALT